MSTAKSSNGVRSTVDPVSVPDNGCSVGVGVSAHEHSSIRSSPIRLLRLAQVTEVTGLRKTKIYELQAEGSFPRRVKITAHSVGWVESEVQAWLTHRIEVSARLQDRQTGPP